MNRCPACGTPLPENGRFCLLNVLEPEPYDKNIVGFNGCELIDCEEIRHSHPSIIRRISSLNKMVKKEGEMNGESSKETKTDEERFKEAYGADCVMSIHGPLPITKEIRS